MSEKYTYSKITPDDLIDRMKTIVLHASVSAIVCRNWEDSEKYLKKALQHRKTGDYCDSVANSKRAVCSAIDRLIHACHLEKYFKKNYIQKIEVFEKIGIEIPLIVHELVIQIRNLGEHEYKKASEKDARYAFEVATLFLGWLKYQSSIYADCAIVFAGQYDDMLVLQKMVYRSIDDGLEYAGTPNGDFIFFDESQDRSQVKIIHPSAREGGYVYKDEIEVEQIRAIREILSKTTPDRLQSSFRCATGVFDTVQVSEFFCRNASV